MSGYLTHSLAHIGSNILKTCVDTLIYTQVHMHTKAYSRE